MVPVGCSEEGREDVPLTEVTIAFLTRAMAFMNLMYYKHKMKDDSSPQNDSVDLQVTVFVPLYYEQSFTLISCEKFNRNTIRIMKIFLRQRNDGGGS